MNIKVVHPATDAKCLVVVDQKNGQLNPDPKGSVVNSLVTTLDRVHHTVVVSIIGPPSTRKTQVVNALIQALKGKCPTPSHFTGFMDPKTVTNDSFKFDAVLVTSPPFVLINAEDGKRVGVVLLDLWYWGSSPELYIKMAEFCYNFSTIRIFTHQQSTSSWWKQADSHQSFIFKKMREHTGPRDQITMETFGNDSQWTFPMIQNGASLSDVLIDTLFRVTFTPHLHHMNSQTFRQQLLDSVKAANSSFSFVQARHPEINKEPSQPKPMETDIDEAIEEFNALRSSYLKKMIEAYKSSSAPFFSSDQLQRHHQVITAELNMNPESDILQSAMAQVKGFHEFLSKSWERWRGEWTRSLESICVQREEAFVQALNSADSPEVTKCIEGSESSSSVAHKIPSAIVKDVEILHVPELSKELEIKLAKHIGPDIVTSKENLERQMRAVCDAVNSFKWAMVERLNKSICLHEEQFREATQKARESIQLFRAEVDSLRLLAVLHEQIEQYEAELRLFNEKRLEEEQRIAAKAAKQSLQIMAELLSPVEEFDVMTNSELAAAHESILAVVMYAFTSVRGFRYSPAWDSAADKVKKEADAILKHLLRENRNKMRRWDRLGDSARRRCFEFYDQLMNECLPPHKITPEELESCHRTCASAALERFRVEEVNEPTRSNLKSLLEVELDAFKEGFVYLNEEKPEVGEEYGAEDENKRDTQSRPSTQYSGKPPRYSDDGASSSTVEQKPLGPPIPVGIYIGPDQIILRALSSDPCHQLKLPPLVTIQNGHICIGEEARSCSNEALYNVFQVLSEPTTNFAAKNVLIGAETIVLQPEEAIVLFFREAITQLKNLTGREINSCTAGIPGLLPGGAKTAIKEALRVAGFKKVALVPITTLLSMYLARIAPEDELTKQQRILSVYHSHHYLEVSCLEVSSKAVHVKTLEGSLDLKSSGQDVEARVQKWMKKSFEIGLNPTTWLSKGPFAIVSTLDASTIPHVRDVIERTSKELVPRHEVLVQSSECCYNLAELDRDLHHHQDVSGFTFSEKPFPEFNYNAPYELKLNHEFHRVKIQGPQTQTIHTYKCNRGNEFSLTEMEPKKQRLAWHYKFHWNGVQPSPNFYIIEDGDGSLRVRPASGSHPSTTVHCNQCRFITSSDTDALRLKVGNLEHMMMMEGRRRKQSEQKEQPRFNTEGPNWRLKLAQCIDDMEELMNTLGMTEGPLFDLVDERINTCRVVEKDASSTSAELEFAFKKLQAFKDELLN